MKTKFKDFLLYTLACFGAVSLLMSVSNVNNSYQSYKGKYEIVEGSEDLYLFDTTTGDIFEAAPSIRGWRKIIDGSSKMY